MLAMIQRDSDPQQSASQSPAISPPDLRAASNTQTVIVAMNHGTWIHLGILILLLPVILVQ